MSKPRENLVAGIDFGTTSSEIGIYKDGFPYLIHLYGGKKYIPSVVGFPRTGGVLVGEDAKRQSVLNPERTFSSIKRDLTSGKIIKIDGKTYTHEQLGAMIVSRLKEEAESALEQEITQAVITVPAYFNQIQRKSVQEIGRLAGLEVLRIINEPTAAAMSYGLDNEEEQNILVFDFGGGTFDVSILNMADGVFEVLATGGDNSLGGDDIDRLIIDFAIAEFKTTNDIDLASDKLALQKLKDEAEKTKFMLTTSPEARLSVPFITANQDGPIHLDQKITVESLNMMLSDILKRLMEITHGTIKDAGIKRDDIDRILLVGGSTRIPVIRKMIIENFGRKIEAGINPIECVSLGASIQGAIINGQITNKVLVDVTPLALGVEIEGGAAEVIVPRNTPIPATQKKIFSTIADDQTEVELRIFQGNSDIAKENIQLGRFILGDVEKAPMGMPQIEVQFDVNVNGIMSVSAKDMKTGAARSVIIQPDSSSGKR
ncbi:MAG: Hsp70 family protein [Nitrospinota bacterium]|nr:Hsp70 family protein [Nitrospinota bacterium]